MVEHLGSSGFYEPQNRRCTTVNIRCGALLLMSMVKLTLKQAREKTVDACSIAHAKRLTDRLQKRNKRHQ